MLLLTAATKKELAPVVAHCADSPDCGFLVTGVGPMETAVVLSRRLLEHDAAPIEAVIHLGVAGAFPDTGLALLDICLARRQILADFGVCLGEDIQPFEQFPPPAFELDLPLLARAGAILTHHHIAFQQGTFLTVNSCSGTAARGRNLRDRFAGICENMEGAAVARVCAEYDLPCLEVRCVSNFVEDRNPANWKLAEAMAEGGRVAAVLALALLGEQRS